MSIIRNKIAVLVATYNGEKYIEEQIQSLLKQTVTNIDIIVNDDGSTDATLSILEKLAAQNSNIRVSQKKQGGACDNFIYLLKYNKDYDYVFLCDQDDVWDPGKIEQFIECVSEKDMNELLLVYCDRQYVDEKLNNIDMVDRNYDDDLKRILFQNHIYGCTMMINRKMVETIRFPKNIAMHDHWIALEAAANGKIIHINSKLVKYRQHSGNVTGGINQFGILNKISSWKRVNLNEIKTIQMCKEFCIRYEQGNHVAGEYLHMLKGNGFLRVLKAIRYGFRRDNMLATMRAYYVLFIYNRIKN